MKATKSFMKTLKPNWKLPEGYLEKAEKSQNNILKKTKGVTYK